LLTAPPRREITLSHWFDGLKADIAERGLGSPLLVSSGRVYHGINRFYAVKDLGWEDVPVIWQSDPPDIDRIELKTMREIQNLLNDGKAFLQNKQFLAVRDCVLLKSGKHPEISEPYWPRSQNST